MLAEFSIIPLGVGTHLSDEIAAALKLVDASGLPYEVTPSGTCVEGEWDEVIGLIRRCHERVRTTSPHIITMIKIEDEEGAHDKLTRNVKSVEHKVGHRLERTKA
ncbi:MAG: MTH1187 family thiamine-binding protein [Ardenticatenaceae bacterium]|nr:MTH1187 family thiamine-binding protein [Ardenticatenaceae bacterium]